MTSDIISVEIGRSTWQGPAEEAPQLAHITRDDLVSALEQIEMLTATGSGLDPDTTMQVHLLAGIGRATHDPYAWYSRADLCASGQQVRALMDAAQTILDRGYVSQSIAEEKPDHDALRDALAALTPAPQPSAATPTAQEAVAWATYWNDGGLAYVSAFKPEPPADMHSIPLGPLAHPPQPGETVAEATNHALDACRIIDAAVLEGHDNTSDLICHLLEAVEPARAALRALKGGSNG